MHPRLEFSCPEKWNLMSPDQGGRYCGSCKKVVTDFSQLTNEEIARQINSGSKDNACGSFKAHQLQDPFGDKRDLLIWFYQKVNKKSRRNLIRMLQLGFVTLLLFAGGCRSRLSGAYQTTSNREQKKAEKAKHMHESRK